MTNKTEVKTQKTKTMKKNPETQTTLETRNRAKTNKREVTTQKTETMKEESKDTENIRHKTQKNDK